MCHWRRRISPEVWRASRIAEAHGGKVHLRVSWPGKRDGRESGVNGRIERASGGHEGQIFRHVGKKVAEPYSRASAA